VLAGGAGAIVAAVVHRDAAARDTTPAVRTASDARPLTRPLPAAVDPVAVAPGLSILPRDAWGADLPPKGPLEPEDSRFLLVHHSASPTNYASARDVLRGCFAYHTSSAKGWKDVCYNFFIGRDGDVWEGRAGSLAGPIVADATGGSQGFAQLVCLLGTYTSTPPSAAMYDSLVSLLAWLAQRDSLALGPDATTSFVSRGSNKWKAGTPITTNTVDGHRDMTYTDCPGNSMYALVPQLRTDAAARRASWDTSVPNDPSGLRPARRLGRVANP
jgi:hypothetical protein